MSAGTTGPAAARPEHLESARTCSPAGSTSTCRRRAARGAEAGRLLSAEGIAFDQAFTSVLKRAIRTLWITLDELDLMWLPVERSWRLNERHYGALQGLDKAQTVERHGAEQVKIWRRSYDIPPPPLARRRPAASALRAPLCRRCPPRSCPPRSRSRTRSRACCRSGTRASRRSSQAGRNVLVAAHGNSLRALVKMLDGMSDAAIVELNIPTGVPLLYDLDETLQPRGEPLPGRRRGDQGARRGRGPPDRSPP